MALEEIASTGDTQALAKTNAVIRKTNDLASAVVDTNAALEATVSEIALSLGAIERPGDARSFFMSTVSGAGRDAEPIGFGDPVQNDSGLVLRVAGTEEPLIVANRQDFAIEPGQVYAARWAASRFQNTSDPYGDAVEFRLAWLSKSKGFISTVLVDKRALTVDDGRFVAEATFSRDQAADLVAPAGARYVRPYVRILGGNGVTDIEVIRRWESNGLPGGRGADGREPEYFLNEDAETIRWRQANGSLGPVLDIGSARKKSEAAAAISAGHASDALSGGMDPGLTTVAGISGLSIPDGITHFNVSGYYDRGDGGGHQRILGTSAGPDAKQSADGKWWEVAAEIVRPEMFGAKGDGVTDDSDAFTRMLKAFSSKDGFDVYLRAKTYKLSSMAIYLTRRIRFFGVSRNTTILDFSASTTVVNAPYNAHIISVHSANIAGTSSKATPIVLPGGTVGNYGENAGLFDLTVTCNPAVPDGIGVFFNVAANSQNVLVRNANLHGFVVAASCTQLQTRGDTVGPSGVDIGGNSNNGLYDNIKVQGSVNGDGIHLNGSDANANQFNHPDASNNRGWGLQDKSSLGNTYVQLHTAGNAFGAYRTRPASTTRSAFINPYAESNQATDPLGIMFEMSGRAGIFNALGVTPDGDLPAINYANDGLVSHKTMSVMDADGTVAAGGAYGRLGRGLMELRSTDGLKFEIKRGSSAFTGLYYGGSLAIQFPNVDGTVLKPSRPHFPNGISLAAGHSQVAAAAAPSDPAIPALRGQIVWNSAPSAGGKVGWVCTTAGSPGTWKAFGAIDA